MKKIVFMLMALIIVLGMAGCMGGKPSSQTPQTDPNIFEKYIGLIGLDKESLIKQSGEEPTVIDEGGLEFIKLGIRAWFKGDHVSQIFTQSTQVDFNGAKVGDSIDKFKEAFGTPGSDRNGDMHFKYNNVFLSVIYDTETKETIAVYILQEDFQFIDETL